VEDPYTGIPFPSRVVGRGRTGRPDHDQQHCYHHAPTVKPETATAVVELLILDLRTSETCWAVHKCQVINLRSCCIWLVDLFELYDDARILTHCGRVTQICVFTLQLCRTGDADLRFYITTLQDGWRRFAFLTRWNSVHLQVLLSATPQGGMFPEVSHPQALLGSLVSISWKFQFTKVVSEFVINF